MILEELDLGGLQQRRIPVTLRQAGPSTIVPAANPNDRSRSPTVLVRRAAMMLLLLTLPVTGVSHHQPIRFLISHLAAAAAAEGGEEAEAEAEEENVRTERETGV